MVAPNLLDDLSDSGRRFVEIAREKGLLPGGRLAEAVEAHRTGPTQHIAEVFGRLGHLSREDIGRVLWIAKSRARGPGAIEDEEWLLGNLLVSQRSITLPELYEVLLRQANLEERGQSFPLGELLVDDGHIERSELQAALAAQAQRAGAAAGLRDGYTRCGECGAAVRLRGARAGPVPCLLCGGSIPLKAPAEPQQAPPPPGEMVVPRSEPGEGPEEAGSVEGSDGSRSWEIPFDAGEFEAANPEDAAPTVEDDEEGEQEGAPAGAAVATGEDPVPTEPPAPSERSPGESTRGRVSELLDKATREREAAGIDLLGELNLAETELGPYLIDEKIGEGAIGLVYRARHRGLGREVALKFLSPKASSDPEAISRFEREARTAGRLVHENIALIYDVGRVASYSFIAMEYIEGHTLEEILTDRRLELDEALGFVEGIASGLAAAHRVGIVHRDVKPQNIMVDHDGRVKLTDFGLARDLWGPSMTRMGAIMGTPLYMSPEQSRGERVDHRSDVFALGVTAYRMLAGIHPFRAETTQEIITRIQYHDPSPLHDLDERIPPEIGELVASMLAKDPTRRPHSLDEAIERIGDARSREPETATYPSGTRLLTILALLLLLGLAGGTALWSLDLLPLGPPSAEVDAVQRALDRDDLPTARERLEELRESHEGDAELARMASRLAQLETRRSALERAEEALVASPPDILGARGALEEAEAIRQDARSREVRRQLRLLAARRAGRRAAEAGEMEEARECFEEALSLVRTADERARTEALAEEALGEVP